MGETLDLKLLELASRRLGQRAAPTFLLGGERVYLVTVTEEQARLAYEAGLNPFCLIDQRDLWLAFPA